MRRQQSIPIHLGNVEESCPDFTRAAPAAECPMCGETYQSHQIYTWGRCPLYLYKTCDGRFWKL